MPPHEIELSVDDRMGQGDSPQHALRTYLSLKHLTSASTLAGMARRGKVGFQEQLLRDALAVGAIFTAVAFVEAVINEIWEDAVDERVRLGLPRLGWIRELPRKQFDRFTKQKPTLWRYQRTLEGCQLEEMDRQADPFLAVEACIQLRHAFTHYRPGWSAVDEPSPIDELLAGKFEIDFDSVGGQVPSNGAGLFPRGCMTRECADWAIGACGDFVREFLDRMADPLATWTIVINLRKRLDGEDFYDHARDDPEPAKQP